MKKCPKCGMPVGGLSVCPSCGADCSQTNTQYVPQEVASFANTFSKTKVRLSVWEVLFIIVCNIAVVLALVNSIMGGQVWCGIPVMAIYTVYFFAFASTSGSAKRFLARYRNAVLVLNIVSALFNAVNLINKENYFGWAFNYFIPCNLLLACLVMLCLLPCKDVPVRNVLLSSVLLLPQSVIQFVVMLCGWTATEQLPRILCSCAFGVNFLTTVNLAFLYFNKYRNVIVEKFRLWE